MPESKIANILRTILNLAMAEALGFGIAGLLLIALALLLPTGTRARVRTPLVLFLVSVAALLLRSVADPASATGFALRIIGVFSIAAAIGQACLLLLADGFFGKRRGQPLPQIFRDILQGLILVAVLFVTLREAGVEPTSLLTTSALLTAVIGLSLQDTLGNLFAGISIQAQRPFEVGDWIQIDTDSRSIGRVVEINWRATTVRTPEQIDLVIPNGVLAKSTLCNFTKPDTSSRRTVEVQAPYDAQPQHVEQELLSAARGVAGVKSDPSPFVLLRTFADSGITYHLNYFIEDFALRDRVDSLVRMRVWFAFRRGGITIPFPARTIYQPEDKSPEALAKAEAQAQTARLAAIQEVDFLAGLPSAAQEHLAALSKSCKYLSGEVIIRQGEAGDAFYIVQSGEVIVLLGRDEHSVAELARLGPGKFFGEMSLMTGERRTATVRAALNCDLVRIDKSAFQSILEADPGLVEQISRVLVERQLEMDENLSARAARSKTFKEEKSNALLASIRKFFSL